MNILIINNGTRVLHNFTRLLSDHNLEIRRHTDLHGVDLKKYDALILTGSSNYSIEWYKETYSHEESIIKNANIPLLGICLGFELISDAFGVRPMRHSRRVMGVKKINIRHTDDIFHTLSRPLVYENHTYRTEAVPDSFELLADSDAGIEAMKHKTKIIYGVQFHPEVYPNRTDGLIILSNFIEIASRHKYANRQH